MFCAQSLNGVDEMLWLTQKPKKSLCIVLIEDLIQKLCLRRFAVSVINVHFRMKSTIVEIYVQEI